MVMMKSVSLLLAASFALGACSTGGTSSGTISGGASGVAPTLFGQALDTEIPVQSHSASLDEGTGLVRSYAQDFSFRSRAEYRKNGDFRRIRYGKPFPSYHPFRNYTVPIVVTTSSGESVGTGSATFSGADVETGVITRTITLTDVELDNSIFGLFSTDDTGPRGDYFEIHAYAAGSAATALPNTATYSGSFLADVIADGAVGASGTATRVNLPANLSVNFLGNTVAGTIGSTSSPDITLSGVISGTDMSGTATVASSGVVVANGSTGTFNGGFYGAGASEAAGTLGISDTAGATNQQLVGAFGVRKD